MNPIRSAIASSLRLLALLALLVCLPLANEARAADEIAVRDGGAAQIIVSARELTRLSMADGSRLEKLFGADGTLDVKPDPDTGAAFIKPVDPQPGRAFSFFVRDDRGATYTLVATVADLPSQTVLLRPVGRPPSAKAKPATGHAEPYMRRLKFLMRAMATGTRSDDFGFEAVGRDVPMWAQARTVLEQRWTGGAGLQGEVWTVSNTTREDLRLDESQFASLYPDVRAVAIARQVLAPDAATLVYVVRGPVGGDS